jgi:hypothetical protein
LVGSWQPRVVSSEVWGTASLDASAWVVWEVGGGPPDVQDLKIVLRLEWRQDGNLCFTITDVSYSNLSESSIWGNVSYQKLGDRIAAKPNSFQIRLPERMLQRLRLQVIDITLLKIQIRPVILERPASLCAPLVMHEPSQSRAMISQHALDVQHLWRRACMNEELLKAFELAKNDLHVQDLVIDLVGGIGMDLQRLKPDRSDRVSQMLEEHFPAWAVTECQGGERAEIEHGCNVCIDVAERDGGEGEISMRGKF